MRKLLLFALLISSVYACSQKTSSNSGFEINGKIKGYESGVIHLKKQQSGNWVTIDSTNSKQGEFKLTGRIAKPELLYIFFEGNKKASGIFVENANISFTASIDNLNSPTVKGSKSNEAFLQFSNELKVFQNKSSDLYKQYIEAKKADNNSLVKEIEESYYKLDEEKTGFIKNYVATHNKSFVTPYIILRELMHSLDANGLDSILKTLDSKLNESVYVVEMNKRLTVLQNVAVGKQAPDFALNDTLGNPISLSSFKGKYLLIDFWAAWCSPCRAENPNNVKLYAKYKDKGFEILGVSFDKSEKAWINAIKKDGLTWSQISDLKGWKCEAGKLYGVRSIPHTVLLDKSGKIIAKNLRGEELNKKIAELLD